MNRTSISRAGGARPCTTISDLNAGLRQTFQPGKLDPETAARVAISYGLVLFRLLPPRALIQRLSEIGISGDAAVEFVSIIAKVDFAIGDKS